jgi:small multidrug resistance family-3 protein
LPYSLALVLLFAAAVLEAFGDSLIAKALRAPASLTRLGLFLAGGATLFCYGFAVNAPRWNFGRLLGVYVAFFFVVAQLIAWLTFGQKPTATILIGGGLIVAGGLVVSLGSS